MIEGVTILATEIVNKPAPWLEIFGCILTIALVCGFLLSVLFIFLNQIGCLQSVCRCLFVRQCLV